MCTGNHELKRLEIIRSTMKRNLLPRHREAFVHLLNFLLHLCHLCCQSSALLSFFLLILLSYQSSCIFLCHLCHLCCIFFALLLLLEPICALHSFGIFIGSILCFCIITCNKIVLLFCISFFLQNLQDKSHLQVETNLREGSLAIPTFLFTIGQNKICFRIFGSPQ